MNKIRRGDEVMLLSGRDKGGRGEVLRVLRGKSGKVERVVVRGINLATNYVRPNPQQNEPGGIVKKEASVHVSNVAVVDPDSSLPARVKILQTDKGKKERRFHVSAKRRA